MTSPTKAAELAEKLDELADNGECIHLQSWSYIQRITREAAALLRASEVWVPDVDDLRDRLVAISIAVAGSDDRAAQSMLREILVLLTAAPHPPAQQAEPAIPAAGPSTFAQRFAEAIRLLVGAIPPADVVAGWLDQAADDHRLQAWIGAQPATPGWAQCLAVTDAAYALASNPIEGEAHELAPHKAEGAEPFEVRIAGPDDVIPFADELSAHRHANAVNQQHVADCLKHPDDHVLCVATVHATGGQK